MAVLRQQISWGVAASVVSTVVQVVLAPVLLAYLGSDGYGVWSVLSVLLLAGPFCEQGLGDALIQFVARSRAQEDHCAESEYISTAMALAIGVSVLLAGAVWLLRALLVSLLCGSGYVFINDEEVARKLTEIGFGSVDSLMLLAGMLGLLLIPHLLWSVAAAAVIGIGKIECRHKAFIIARLSQLVVTIVLLCSGVGIWSLWGAQAVFHLVFFCGLLFVLTRNQCVWFGVRNIRVQRIKELMIPAGGLLATRLVQMCVEPLLRIMIGRIVGMSSVAWYDVAMKMLRAVQSVFATALKVIIPRAATADIQMTPAMISTAQRRYHLWVFAIGGVCLWSISFFSEPLMKLWLGDSYDEMMPVAVWLLMLPMFINLSCFPDYYALIGAGQIRSVFCATLCGAVVMVGCWLMFMYISSLNFGMLIGGYGIGVVFNALGMRLGFCLYCRSCERKEAHSSTCECKQDYAGDERSTAESSS